MYRTINLKDVRLLNLCTADSMHTSYEGRFGSDNSIHFVRTFLCSEEPCF
jgi:hypothetical protein